MFSVIMSCDLNVDEVGDNRGGKAELPLFLKSFKLLWKFYEVFECI